MSEEEKTEIESQTIKELNKFAHLTFLYGKTIGFTQDQFKMYQEAVRNMLSLYEKEKQKVKTKIIGRIDQVSLDDLIGDAYVRKDKIIKILIKHKETPLEQGYLFYKDIKKLLEEHK